MHDVSSLAWRQILDRNHTALADELSVQLATEVESRVAVERERAELAENQLAEARSTLERERGEHEAARERERLNIEAACERDRAEHEATLTRERAEHKAARERLNIEAAQERERLTIEERSQAARRIAESLNQTLRRIRQTSAEHETLQLLLEDSAGFSDSAVVVLIENNQVRVAASRGAAFVNEKFTEPEHHEEEPEHDEAERGSGSVSLSDAPAIASCVESRDPVIAMMSAAEISPLLNSALSGTGAARAYLFPIAVRQTTVAMTIACGNVSPAPIELLCEAAGMKLEAFELMHAAPAPTRETAQLVQISESDAPSAATASAGQRESTPTTWSKLTPEQQALHLRAQRTARVRVAQIRISESDALRAGARAGNIYDAVRRSIDAARQEFHQAFMSQSPTMVDYLHLEIVRSLAHDDIGLMGDDYPGPIV